MICKSEDCSEWFVGTRTKAKDIFVDVTNKEMSPQRGLLRIYNDYVLPKYRHAVADFLPQTSYRVSTCCISRHFCIYSIGIIIGPYQCMVTGYITRLIEK